MIAALYFFGVFLGLMVGVTGTRAVYRERLKHMTHWKDYWEKEAMRVNVILYEEFGIDTGEEFGAALGDTDE